MSVTCVQRAMFWLYFVLLYHDTSKRDGNNVHANQSSLTTEKQTTKFSPANFQKMLSPSYIKD